MGVEFRGRRVGVDGGPLSGRLRVPPDPVGLVFTDIGQDHGGGRTSTQWSKFVNKYRAKPAGQSTGSTWLRDV